jgi:hypothetical protein
MGACCRWVSRFSNPYWAIARMDLHFVRELGSQHQRQFPTISDSFSVDGSVDMLQHPFVSHAGGRHPTTSHEPAASPMSAARDPILPKICSENIQPQP